MVKKTLLALVVIAVALVGYLLWLASKRDEVLAEIQSPSYVENAKGLSLTELYSQYERDMDIRPPRRDLSAALALRGDAAARYILDLMKDTPDPKKITNAIIVFEEMRRTNTFDVCQDRDSYAILNAAVRRVDHGNASRVLVQLRGLCASPPR
jgi:hypothetical protein